MKARWLNAFTIIGIILLGLGIYGICKGPAFIFDPGQLANGHEAWYYLLIGALMILNGFMLPAPLPNDQASAEKADKSSQPVKQNDGPNDDKAEFAAGRKVDRRQAERL
jgi:hypothetical protein